MTDQLTIPRTARADRGPQLRADHGADRPAEQRGEHWTQHTATEFPRRTADHSPNLATLDQLRSSGRNALLLPASRRRVSAPGCTGR